MDQENKAGIAMDVLRIETQDAVRILTLQRPERHNALNTALTSGLLQAVRDADSDQDCRAIVLSGSGKSFCAGADTTEFAGFGQDAEQARARGALTAELHAVFATLSKPVVAAVWGNALGGGAGLALSCDMVVAAQATRLGYPEITHGICPAIVMANLTRNLGPKRAFELVSTGRVLNGAELYQWGLANASADTPEATLSAAFDIGRRWATYAPYALSSTKQLFYRTLDLTFPEGLAAGRELNIAMRRHAHAKA
ncbi:enoyl-CoA hydratase/isomerase family protein [Bordetella sp. LUAb4]|uniref:enoyl-CoA hydratase/isomerase family protein n=1 Tax=Bordetella sp. LUAb4 TaxID=2843195 RepID=UPI001E440374|nr:enoyl-CoA hydratase/isomerase family protein [Bordetella sp. LUAb4]